MRRIALLGIVLTLFFGGILGCGGSDVPPPEERPGVKERQAAQKEKKGESYMMPPNMPKK